MGVHRFARALYDMQSKLIDKLGRKSITDEVKIRQFLNNIPDIIKKAITPHLTDNMTCDDIVTQSEQFEGVNRVAFTRLTKARYPSKVSRYTYAANTRSSYRTQQPRPDKGQPPQNRLATTGGRSSASAGTKDSEWDKIRKTLSEKERIRRVRDKLWVWCGLAVHNLKECRKRLTKEPMRTAAQEMRL